MSEPQSEASRVVGERIRATRLKLGLSQEDIADLAEMHVTNVGKIERGQANPTLSTLVSLAGALNVDAAEWIANLTTAMLPERTHTVTAADLIRERHRLAR
ncbi:helix-turn-helix domain-containing protein [Subtercola sp. PAMC28395]|uniref:helix-turn-helix domain-containing protein n=1 Tax=Subtercola sp. PAMC28395 TaxID=2846775 RepID=UPI001C0C6C14|nr:helix-turn-helix transcriptional regulator [Subtercola sp. PAMC28395]QWT24686.1 helix-turn-helix domain-containing protein [Subtercola sp. PAMC28395]